MIKNDRQYRITKTQAEKFQKALDTLSVSPADENVHPMLRKAQKDAIKSQLDDLKIQISDYEALKSGKIREFEAQSLEDLPVVLIKARIASGLSQRELAQKLLLKEQQIQRYEATDYASASLARILKILKVLGTESESAITFSNLESVK